MEPSSLALESGPPVTAPQRTHCFSLDHTASSKHSKDLQRVTGRHTWAKDTKRAQQWVTKWASSLAYIAKIRVPKHVGHSTRLLHFHLWLWAVKSGAPVIEVKVNYTLRSPQTSCRTTYTTQGWSFPEKDECFLLSNHVRTSQEALVLDCLVAPLPSTQSLPPNVLQCRMAAPLSRAYSTSSLPGLRDMLCPSPQCWSACNVSGPACSTYRIPSHPSGPGSHAAASLKHPIISWSE